MDKYNHLLGEIGGEEPVDIDYVAVFVGLIAVAIIGLVVFNLFR